MAYGRLELTVGPMFAGKTESLIKEVLWRTYHTSDVDVVAILKPSYDTRYAEEEIVSHSGARVVARAVNVWPDDVDGRHKAIFLDEIQFFTEPFFKGSVIEDIRRMRDLGVDVYCSGLDMDYMGRGFEISGLLMAESTRIQRLTARCEFCPAPATMTGRRHPGSATSRFDLGAGAEYAPLCADHWREHIRENEA